MADFQELLQKVSRKQGALRNKLFGSPIGGKKVFGIGLNKTGTSTLGACFSTLGFRHLYDVHRLTQYYFDGDLESIFKVIEGHDSFEDWPIPLIYKELYERFGEEALFVLTLRKTPEVWLNSLSRHAKRINHEGARNIRKNIYGYESPDGHEAEHLKIYDAHTASVIEFFEQKGARDQLLVICWENGDDWTQLCDFFGVSKPWVSFPHVNKGGK